MRIKVSLEPPETAFWKSQGLTTRAANALAARKIGSWEGLSQFTVLEISAFPNMGKVSLGVVQESAAKAGVILQQGEPKRRSRQSFRRETAP